MKYAFIILILTGTSLPAQTPDTDRMQRDIEVAENILASLLGEDEAGPYPALALASEVEGSYLEGFGVLFTIAPRYRLRSFRVDDARVLWGTARSDSDRHRPDSIRERPPAPTPDTIDNGAIFRKVVETFATDYAYLLRQLPAGEKLMIRNGSSSNSPAFWRVAALGTPAATPIHTAVIEKADIDAFVNDRLNREKFLTRIRFTTGSQAAGAADRDLALLSSIFSRLYESDLSESFCLYGSVNFERIDGLGAVYHLTLGPKSERGAVYFSDGQRIRLRERGGVVVPMPENPEPATEKTSKLETAYPAFLADLKANIVEYGSIVKNLAPGEALIFRIQFMTCGDCKTIPEKVEITCPKATLDNYRNNKISLEEATRQLK